MNAFEQYNITHLSVSKCNRYQADPALTVLEDLMGFKSIVGCAAYRGTASEHGVALGLTTDATLDECQAAALLEFDKLSALSTDSGREKERAAVPGIVEMALAELKPYGKPSETQRKIEWSTPELPVPFVGFIDFIWADHGIIVDLKSQLRLSSEINSRHARQVALYCAACGDNYDGRVTYATPKKAATYKVENMREHVAALVRIGKAIERFLSVSSSVDELAQMVVPNTDSFYYSDPLMRQKAFEVFGI